MGRVVWVGAATTWDDMADVPVPGNGGLPMGGRVGRDVDRLTGPDLWMLEPDEFGWPQDIGAVGIVDGRSLLEPDGTVRVEAVRDEIGRRLHLVPKLRKVLYRPGRGLGGPLWVDAPSFDLADHVGVFAVDPPGGETQLLGACERLGQQPLDRSRPLWELWLLPGLGDGRIGLYVRLHHAIADGIAGVSSQSTGVTFWRPFPVVTYPGERPATRRRRARRLRSAVALVARRVRRDSASRSA